MKLRILRNQEGSSPGNGAAPQPPAQTPAEPQAQGAAQLDARKLAEEVRNSVFAEMRKAGLLGKRADEQPATTPATPPAQASPQPVDTQTLIARERAFSRAMAGSGRQMSDAQVARMERAYEAEAPPDPAGWVKGYLADMFGTASGTITTPGPSGPPRSDHGSPAPVSTNADTIDPWRLSEDQVREMVRRDGMAAVGKMASARMRRSLSGQRLIIPRRP
jgi:hypothetical protein